MGSPGSPLEAGHYIATIENQQKYIVARLEEIALNQELIIPDEFSGAIERAKNPDYRTYLDRALEKFASGQ